MKREIFLLSILIAFSVFGCSLSTRTPSSTQVVNSQPLPINTDSPTSPPDMVDKPTQTIAAPTPLSQHEMPTAISQETTFTIEVTATISAEVFHFVIDFRKLAVIPEVPPGYTFSPVKEIAFFYGNQELPIDLEETGGKGGSSDEADGTFTIHQEFFYKLKSLFPPGEEQHIIAVITLDEVLGRVDPVRVELEVIPK